MAKRYKTPPIDPTKNVLSLVAAAIQRQDDMRNLEAKHIAEMSDLRVNYEHRIADMRSADERRIADLRASDDAKLREAETARIDAIRAVDVGAVNRAAEVSATQAATLATQVSVSAETLRGQVAAAAGAATTALAAALEPIQKDIADLRRAQYEAQGQKTQVVETRDVRAESRLNVNTLLMALSVLAAALIVYATFKK